MSFDNDHIDSPAVRDHRDEDDSAEDDSRYIDITVIFKGESKTERFHEEETFAELAATAEMLTGVEIENQKYMVKGLGFLRPTRDNAGERSVRDFENKKITLFGTPTADQASFNRAAQIAAHRAQQRHHHASHSRPLRRSRSTLAETESARYAFNLVRSLPALPKPADSQALLERLASDPAVRAAMRKHKLSVGLLTEMEPLSNTEWSRDGATTRLLGLNRNQGEVIELRLWTDAYDGFRDYNTIRKTLCHELAHNRHGPHDRQFWDFCHQIERDVHERSVGRTTSGEAFAPSHEDEVDDHGGWTGGTFVLGSGAAGAAAGQNLGLDRREILARAAEQRRRRMDDDDPNGGNQQGSSSGPEP